MTNFVEQINGIYKVDKIATDQFISIAADQKICAINDRKFVGFDFIVVHDSKESSTNVCGLLNRVGALHETDSQLVVRKSKHFLSLSEELLISEQAGIIDYIVRAKQNPTLLLMGANKVTGIVTVSDLQKIQTKSAFISLFLHFEDLLTKLLRTQLGQAQKDVINKFTNSRAEKISKKIRELTDKDLFVDIWCALDFGDKKNLFLKNKLAVNVSNSDVRKEFATIEKYRNLVAHSSAKAELFASENFIVATKNLIKWIEVFETNSVN